MMRQIFSRSNFIIFVGIALLFVTVLFSPKDIYAVEVASPKALAESSNAAAKTSPFCTNLATDSSKLKTNINNLVTKLTASWALQGSDKNAQWQQIDQKVAANRQAADTKLTDSLANLAEKATSDSQKQAITVYSVAVNAALMTRRNDTDTVRSTFRNAVDNLLTTRKDTVSAQLSKFQSAVYTAATTATDSCSADQTNGVSIHKTYQDSLTAARAAFQNDRSGDDKIKSELLKLTNSRNDSFKLIDTTFQASMTAARTALQDSLKNTSI